MIYIYVLYLQIIDHLLDVENIPRKPQYRMAAELPLVLFDCQFEDVNWIIDKGNVTLLMHLTLMTKYIYVYS